MEDSSNLGSDLVQLARVSLIGRRQDSHLFVRRLARRYRKTAPGLCAQLNELLKESSNATSPLRSRTIDAVPTDTDSRLRLLRIEAHVELGVTPIFSDASQEALEQVVMERKAIGRLVDAGLVPAGKLLFSGPPGVGKTLAARWLAQQLNLPLLTLDLSAVMSSLLGKTGTNLRHVLEYAKGVDCVLLLDEIDAVAKRRDDIGEVGELKRLVTVLLQELDDWPTGNILVAATNHPGLLDPAVWRRFDELVEFPLPSTGALAQLAAHLLDGQQDKIKPLIDVLSTLFTGRSFAELERFVTSAHRRSIFSDRPFFLVALEKAVNEVGMTREDRRRVARVLAVAGLGQREINRITGVSRETIRGYQRRGQGD